MAPVLLPSCVAVFRDKQPGIVKGLRAGWALSDASTSDLGCFGFSDCRVGFGFLVDAFFGLWVLCTFCCRFQRPGAWCGI